VSDLRVSRELFERGVAPGKELSRAVPKASQFEQAQVLAELRAAGQLRTKLSDLGIPDAVHELGVACTRASAALASLDALRQPFSSAIDDATRAVDDTLAAWRAASAEFDVARRVLREAQEFGSSERQRAEQLQRELMNSTLSAAPTGVRSGARPASAAAR